MVIPQRSPGTYDHMHLLHRMYPKSIYKQVSN
uniref:Uncharacterized protein n=1 Tax=Anguilla anguilla TaxID=7936 RepID=A0A0E9QXM9_ANGAN